MCYLSNHTHTHTVQYDKCYFVVEVSTKPDRTLMLGKLSRDPATSPVKEGCGPRPSNQILLSLPPHLEHTENGADHVSLTRLPRGLGDLTYLCAFVHASCIAWQAFPCSSLPVKIKVILQGLAQIPPLL